VKERVPLNREEFLQALRPRRNHDQREGQFRQAHLRQEQPCHHANSPEVGEARETLAVNYKGKEIAIAFNPRYLIDALNALGEDEVFFELIDELSPGSSRSTARSSTSSCPCG